MQVRDRSVKVHVDHLLSSNVQDRMDAMGSVMVNDFASDVSDQGTSSVTQPHVPMEMDSSQSWKKISTSTEKST